MRGFWRVAILVTGAAILVAIVARTGGTLVARNLWRIGWRFALLVALRAGYVAARAGALWRVIPKGILSFSELWWIRLSTEAVEMFTFTGPLLAEPAKGWLLKRRGLTTGEAFGFVTLEYLLYTMVTGWMAAAAMGVLIERGAISPALRPVVAGVLISIAVATTLFVYAVVSGTGLVVPLLRRIGDLLGRGRGTALAARLDPGERALVAFLHGNRPHLLQALAMLAAAQVLLALEVWIVFGALGTRATLVDAAVFEGAVKFIDVVFFFVPGQLGAQEGLYSVVAGALGVMPATGLTLALARRIRGLLVASAAAFAPFAVASRARRSTPPNPSPNP